MNCLIAGLRLVRETGINAPPRVVAVIAAYRLEADTIGIFLSEFTIAEENARLSTSLLYTYYAKWSKDNGYSALNGTGFGIEMRRRFEIRRTGKVGNMIVGLALAPDVTPNK